METCKVVRTFESLEEIHGVTIQMKPFYSVPVTFFSQWVIKTIRGVTNLEGSDLVRVVTRVSNGTPYNFNY